MALNDTTTAETLYGNSTPASRGAQPVAPAATTAARLYDADNLAPPIRQAITNRQDDLATALRLDAAAQHALGREVADAVTGAGFDLYSYDLFQTLFNGVVDERVATARGHETDEVREREQHDATLRELQDLYGREETTKLLARVQRALKMKAPALSAVITRARRGNDAQVLRALVEWVRAENLGRV